MDKNRQLLVNISSAVVAFLASLFISFFFTPFIVNNIGAEVFGFFKLANNIGDYTLILTMVINTMSARFLTVRIYKNDIIGASKYFTSIFFANISMTCVLGIPLTLLVIYLDHIVNISAEILVDVKWLFALVFINLLVKTVFSIYGAIYYTQNKTYIASVVKLISSILQVVLLITLYAIFPPKIMYHGISLLIVGTLTVAFNIAMKERLIPGIRVKLKYLDKGMVIESSLSGWWNSVNRLSRVLLDGLDLLIANMLIGPTAMSVIAISKTIPSLMSNLIATIVQSYSPHFTILYAKGQMEELKNELFLAMKIVSIVIITPIAGFVVVGDQYYSLWVPSQDAKLLQMLSIVVVLSICIVGCLDVLKNIFVTTDNLRIPAIVMLVTGIASTLLVFILLHYTRLGIWAIIGVSAVIAVVREMLFTPYYAAKLLNIKRRAIYNLIGKILGTLGVNIWCFVYIERFMNSAYSWSSFIILSGVLGVIGYIISLVILLNGQEKERMMKQMLRKRGNR